MKKILALTTALSLLLAFASCKEKEPKPGETEPDPVVSISVTGIENNRATVTATLEEGKFYGGKILTSIRISDVAVNYTRELALISFVNRHANSIELESLPFTVTLEGLRADTDFLSAVIVYGKDGVAISSAYDTWTSVGDPEGWSNENNAGELDDNTL